MKNHSLYINKIFGFDHFWDAHLSVALKNAEMMMEYPNKKECKNGILEALLNAYVQYAIKTALLNIYQVVGFVCKCDPTFKYKEADPNDPIGLVIGYRNKLVTHLEEASHTSTAKELKNRLESKKGNIFRDIEIAAAIIKDWIESNNFRRGTTRSTVHYEFLSEDFMNLIKSAPELKLKWHF